MKPESIRAHCLNIHSTDMDDENAVLSAIQLRKRPSGKRPSGSQPPEAGKKKKADPIMKAIKLKKKPKPSTSKEVQGEFSLKDFDMGRHGDGDNRTSLDSVKSDELQNINLTEGKLDI
jgi:hypothetical protein